MKRFRFSLQVLLEKRKREEEEVKLELAQINRQIYSATQELYALKSELQTMQDEQKCIREHTSDLLSLKHSVMYRNKLMLDMMKKNRAISSFQKNLEEIRQRLVKITQHKKALELVREKKYKEWLKENKHREQVFIDDISQQKFIRIHTTTDHSSVL